MDGGKGGIYIDQARKLPVTSRGGSTADLSYKICVCVPSGRVFAVAAPLRCDQANEEENPCDDIS